MQEIDLRSLRTLLLVEALLAEHFEVYLPDYTAESRRRFHQTVVKLFVAVAMRSGGSVGILQTVLGLASRYGRRAFVVLTATRVRLGKIAEIVVVGCSVAVAAPFRPYGKEINLFI